MGNFIIWGMMGMRKYGFWRMKFGWRARKLLCGDFGDGLVQPSRRHHLSAGVLGTKPNLLEL